MYSYGLRFVEQLLSPEEQAMLRETVVTSPDRDEVRRAARAFWRWTCYVWSETERVLEEKLPIRLDEGGLLSAVDRIYSWESDAG